MSDLQTAYDALVYKNPMYTTLKNYYNGDQPLKYSAERLKEAFDSLRVKFIQNWCGVVVDADLDRLELKGFDVSKDESAKQVLKDFFDLPGTKRLINEVHKNALITGESFIIFDRINDQVTAFFNNSANVEVFYDEFGNIKMAAKKWVDDLTKKNRINLYYPNRIMKYEAGKDASSANAFKLTEDIANPFKRVPVIRFEAGFSELAKIITIQDAVNKMFSDMMVVGEFNAFRQRWIITNAKMSDIKSSPKTVIQIPMAEQGGEDTKVGEFEAADLTKFLESMDKLANSIAVITRTPKHYFMDTGSNVSGEALLAMESPLVKKVKHIREWLDISWKATADFILEDNGIQAEVSPSWERIESVQPKTEAETMKLYKDMGFPLVTICRRAGWSEDEIVQLQDDLAKDKEGSTTEAELLLEKLRNADANKNPVTQGGQEE